MSVRTTALESPSPPADQDPEILLEVLIDLYTALKTLTQTSYRINPYPDLLPHEPTP